MALLLYLLLILLILILALLIWLVIARISIRVSSNQFSMEVNIPAIINASLIWEDIAPVMKIKVAFLSFSTNLNNSKKEGKKQIESNQQQKRQRSKGKGRRKIYKIVNLIKSLYGRINVDKCRVVIDTDNYALNAQLFPLAAYLNQNRNVNITINFQGVVGYQIEFSTRLYRLAGPMFRYAFTK